MLADLLDGESVCRNGSQFCGVKERQQSPLRLLCHCEHPDSARIVCKWSTFLMLASSATACMSA